MDRGVFGGKVGGFLYVTPVVTEAEEYGWLVFCN